MRRQIDYRRGPLMPSRRLLMLAPLMLLAAPKRISAQTLTALMGCCEVGHAPASGGGLAGSSSAVWDQSTSGSLITFPDAVTALHSGASGQNTVRLNTALSASVPSYWEIDFTTIAGNAFSPIRVGLEDAVVQSVNEGGIGNIGGNHDGGLSIFKAQVASDFTSSSASSGNQDAPSTSQIVSNGGTLGALYNPTTGRFFVYDGTSWYGDGNSGTTDTPVTPTGGLDTSSNTGPLYPAVTLWANTDKVVWRSGALLYTPPSVAGLVRV